VRVRACVRACACICACVCVCVCVCVYVHVYVRVWQPVIVEKHVPQNVERVVYKVCLALFFLQSSGKYISAYETHILHLFTIGKFAGLIYMIQVEYT
jgi:hypothetical protein